MTSTEMQAFSASSTPLPASSHAAPAYDGDCHNRRHENAADLVGQLRDGRLAGGRLLHQRHDAGEGGVLSDAGRADFQKAGHVDRGGHHDLAFVAVTGMLRSAPTMARPNASRAPPSTRHALAHGEQHDVAGEISQGDDALLAVAQHGRRLGRGREQQLNPTRRCLPAGAPPRICRR